ncbi:integrase, catalytic region, zinc finger, CCHC-type containing protein [Tanacetum coccineum]|uniref:Integrase, catalytic region, zinc finger, CCHC-type containing protein n=1 Tax=Tanacetum coccineum TaxID=301880 RepID=A0ABQ5I1Q9_9ASTR
MTESLFVDSGFVVPMFSPGDDPITCLNKAMAFLTAIASSRGDKGKIILVLLIRAMLLVQGGNTTSGQARVVKCYNCQGEGHMARQYTHPKRPRNATWYKEKAMLAEAQEARQILDEDQLAFLADLRITADCDDLSTAQVVLMANISNYGSDVISEDFEQSPVMDFIDNEISSDSNIIPYSQYLQETQQATVQDTNLPEQQDSMILSVIEQISKQMINHKLALKEQVDLLEQNLSKQIKEKESVLQTFAVFKNESKEKENKYMENEIDLEKKIKELDNIICKVGYQNPFYLKKAQRIKPTLYDGVVMSNAHVAMPVIDDEETLILEEESR